MLDDGKWIDVEISWSAKSGKLKVIIEDKVVLTTSPKEFAPEDKYIGFGAGTVDELHVKNPRIKISKYKKDD